MARLKGSRPIIVAIVFVALVLGVWTNLQLREPSRAQLAGRMTVVTLLPSERPLPDLQLVDQDGVATGRDAFTGQWTLLFMGFTSCGHVCPMTMAKLKILHDQLNQPLNIVFVSVDPDRDTPDKIRQYVQNFDSDFSGMTGAPEQIDLLARTLGAPYAVDRTSGDYVVDHSSALFLISPDMGFAGVVTPPLEINAIADDLAILL
jgi:protein SCO1/2